MSEASNIIKDLDMSDSSIAKAIGFTRVAVLRARLEQSNGERMLSALRKLYQLQKGKSSSVAPSVPSSTHITTSKPKPQDREPLTEEELSKQEEWDKYAAWEEYQPVAYNVGQVIKGLRGKVVESILPEGYSVTRSSPYWGENMRVVESTPQPPKPKGRPYWEKPTRTRRHKQTHYVPQHSILSLIAAIFLSRVTPTSYSHQLPSPYLNDQRLLPAAHSNDGVPRYIPTTFLGNDTGERLRLSQPAFSRVSPLGHTAQIEQRGRPYWLNFYRQR